MWLLWIDGTSGVPYSVCMWYFLVVVVGGIVVLLTLLSDPAVESSDVVQVCLAASRGLQRFTVVLLMMNGLASPRGISAKPDRSQMITFFFYSYDERTGVTLRDLVELQLISHLCLMDVF